MHPTSDDDRTATPPLLRTAVSYVRVSTTAQATRARARDGFSIPAQRDANSRDARSLGALVVAEFIERGASARSVHRPEPQRMLTYVAEHRVDFVVVHKLDRLARNRADDVRLTQALRDAGSRLVSTTEAISDSPDGRLMHGIMAAIAEFYSHNLSLEVTKGMRQKAKQGGTVGRAPIGYLNQRTRDADDRDDASVIIDPERAEHVTWAFTSYATGNRSLAQLAEALTQRGLTTRPMTGRGHTTITPRTVRKILTNPYYNGTVAFGGITAAGTHPPLIDTVTWHAVQDMLAARRPGERERIHDHPLKGTVTCYRCGRRLVLHRARSKSGAIYEYFICSARRGVAEPCTQPAVRLDETERRVDLLYQRLTLPAGLLHEVEDVVTATTRRHLADLDARLRQLKADTADAIQKRDRLPRLRDDSAVPADIYPELHARAVDRIAQLGDEQAQATSQRVTTLRELQALQAGLADLGSLYRHAEPGLQRRLNAAVFETDPHRTRQQPDRGHPQRDLTDTASRTEFG